MYHSPELEEALVRHGIPMVSSVLVPSLDEALAAARGRALPLDLRPADPFPGKAVRRVEHMADIPLAYEQARRAASNGVVRLQQAATGLTCYLNAEIHGRRIELMAAYGVARTERLIVDVELWGPLPLDEARIPGLEGMPLVLPDGPALFETVLFADEWRVADAACGALAELFPAGTVGPTGPGAIAVAWIVSHSGVVEDVLGAETARAVPGVTGVVIEAAPGDTLGHVVDRQSRDRVGYVVAAADTPSAALLAARTARDLCEIVTRKTLD